MSAIVPITVFTGFLGAGKTSIILAVTKRVPKDYRIVVLKNEFGDVKVDSELIRESSVQVTEMLNGCMCCVLVGQMRNALLEIYENYHPDRIIVETSGSAFPAPIAWQIRELRRENLPFCLDAIITVVDCVNFRGYEDTSYTAKMQAKYTDVIVLNKWELVSERELDLLLDHVNELNDETPKIKSEPNMGGVAPDLIFGLDTRLFEVVNSQPETKEMSEILANSGVDRDTGHHWGEVDLIRVVRQTGVPDKRNALDPVAVTEFLKGLNKEDVFRVKGFVRLHEPIPHATLESIASEGVFLNRSTALAGDTLYILNWAFGRWTWTALAAQAAEENDVRKSIVVKVTVMGLGLRMWRDRIAHGFSAVSDRITGERVEVVLTEAERR
ncbi:cobW-domain-containing protein [Gonapodya prolifera JEL478]|uniref:CobW-domain-containing protein n=1 Tax=Gonapodya prolifera (strain JEL478) TaxID=1344416 RepID=A0A139A100_GONPJ|nr:cobW-domain-containing protein [Gonapodya prolifera JEL478]|eukprot:KXS10422.1 cobW-domain-containing protein [Gonapodya prolifera JEL478]